MATDKGLFGSTYGYPRTGASFLLGGFGPGVVPKLSMAGMPLTQVQPGVPEQEQMQRPIVTGAEQTVPYFSRLPGDYFAQQTQREAPVLSSPEIPMEAAPASTPQGQVQTQVPIGGIPSSSLQDSRSGDIVLRPDRQTAPVEKAKNTAQLGQPSSQQTAYGDFLSTAFRRDPEVMKEMNMLPSPIPSGRGTATVQSELGGTPMSGKRVGDFFSSIGSAVGGAASGIGNALTNPALINTLARTGAALSAPGSAARDLGMTVADASRASVLANAREKLMSGQPLAAGDVVGLTPEDLSTLQAQVEQERAALVQEQQGQQALGIQQQRTDIAGATQEEQARSNEANEWIRSRALELNEQEIELDDALAQAKLEWERDFGTRRLDIMQQEADTAKTVAEGRGAQGARESDPKEFIAFLFADQMSKMPDEESRRALRDAVFAGLYPPGLAQQIAVLSPENQALAAQYLRELVTGGQAGSFIAGGQPAGTVPYTEAIRTQ